MWWAIKGLFYIDDDQEWEIKDEYKYSGYLHLGKDRDDTDKCDATSIMKFFRYHGAK